MNKPTTGPGPWQVVKSVAAIITPLTLITALMYYFGLIHAYWFFSTFGVDYTVFNLSPEDYIIRSADGLIFPFCVAALAILALTWLFQFIAPGIGERAIHWITLVVVPVFSVLGIGCVVLAGFAFLKPLDFVDTPAVGGLALVFGVLLLTGAIRAMRRLAERASTDRPRASASWVVAEWTAVIMLVSVGLFWAAGDWSARVGKERANQVEDQLDTWPSVVLYSEQSLNLHEPGVTESVCPGVESAFGYRYDGLALITQEGGQLLLLPRAWSSTNGTAIVLTKTDSVRLEFTPSTSPAPTTC
ncbi:hypothetical protein B2K11_19985 [Microbacterium sp. B35-30]|nr:hypothetical protein B2K11_19985 [Microbacterium sp. B35-30]